MKGEIGLRDLLVKAIVPALIRCDGNKSTPEYYAERGLAIANAILAQRSRDKKEFLATRREREPQRWNV